MISIFLVSLLIFTFRLIFIWQGKFSFSWDFARDLLWIRQLTIQHKPILVGPWGSLDGSYFGPLYYYFLAPALLFFKGDPRAAAGMVSLLLSLMIIIGYQLGKKYLDKTSGIIIALLLAFMPIFTQLSLDAFSQNLVPLIYLLFFITQLNLIKKPSTKTIFLVFLLSSLLFHFEPINTLQAWLITAGLLIFLWKKKKINLRLRSFIAGFTGVILPFIPNIIFDIRHQFPQLRAFMRFFLGKDQSLHGDLSFLARFPDRLKQFWWILTQTFFGKTNLVGLLVMTVFFSLLWFSRKKIISSLKKNQASQQFLGLVAWNILGSFIYFLLFSRLLKSYYLYPLSLLYILAIGGLVGISLKRKSSYRPVFWLLFILLIFSYGVQLFADKYIKANSQTYFVQQSIVDEIYQQAQGGPFKAYTYTPSIYDYPYQHLFSQYGYSQYGYIPLDYAYLPDQPTYLLNKEFFDQNKPVSVNSRKSLEYIFLILEPGDHLAYSKSNWLKHFPLENQVDQKRFPGKIELIQIKIQDNI